MTVDAGLLLYPEGLADRLHHLLGKLAIHGGNMFGCIEAGHAETQQGRGIGHGADDAVMATGHLAKARHLDASRDGDEQLALKGAQLGNQSG